MWPEHVEFAYLGWRFYGPIAHDGTVGSYVRSYCELREGADGRRKLARHAHSMDAERSQREQHDASADKSAQRRPESALEVSRLMARRDSEGQSNRKSAIGARYFLNDCDRIPELWKRLWAEDFDLPRHDYGGYDFSQLLVRRTAVWRRPRAFYAAAAHAFQVRSC